MSLEDRISRLAGAIAAPPSAPRAPVVADRFLTIALAGDMAALGEVKTSAAFAQRFDTEVNSSGLALDLGARSVEDAVKICHVCGMQAGRFDERCANCRSDLTTAAQSQTDGRRREEANLRAWQEEVRAGLVPEARFARVVEARPLPSRPWRLPSAVAKERFEPPPAAVPESAQESILSRFLGVFVSFGDRSD